MGVRSLLQHAVSLRWGVCLWPKHLGVGQEDLWFVALAVPVPGSSEGAGSALPHGASRPKWNLHSCCCQDVFLSSASSSLLDFSKCHRLWLTGDKRSAYFKGHGAGWALGSCPPERWELPGGQSAPSGSTVQIAWGQPQLHRQ